MQLTTCSGASALRSMIAFISSVVASRMSCASLRFTLMAPRRAKRRCGMAAIVSEPASLAACATHGDVWRPIGSSTHRQRAQALDLRSLHRRCAPGARPSRRSGPNATRSSASTGWPTASHMRRTWRLRPSWIVSSISVRAEPAHARGRGGAVLQLDAAAQRPQRAIADGTAAERRAVGLRHFKARVRQPVGELAVVGEQDQPTRVGVQAPDRVQAQAARPDTRSSTVRRPWGSRAVETTPSGLLTA